MLDYESDFVKEVGARPKESARDSSKWKRKRNLRKKEASVESGEIEGTDSGTRVVQLKRVGFGLGPCPSRSPYCEVIC